MSLPLIMVPARMASTRLPRKVLADIHGKPMIQHVLERALAANLGPVVLACDHPEVEAVGQKLSVPTFLTDPDLASGSDRIYQALKAFDEAGKYTHIVNVQGDLPTLTPDLIGAVLKPLEAPEVDIGTLATRIQKDEERDNPHIVKIALAGDPDASLRRALYFSRSPVPSGAGPHYHHIGLYAYRRHALEKFVAFPPACLEKQERLEQLRALEANFRIDVHLVETVPLGVDSPEDLAVVRSLLAPAES